MTVEELSALPIGSLVQKRDSVIRFLKTDDNEWTPGWIDGIENRAPLQPLFTNDDVAERDVYVLRTGGIND